jgi:hypothetical protein
MENKGSQLKQFKEAALAKKVTLTPAENTATTIYFAVTSSEVLMSLESIELYNHGEIIFKRVTGRNY